MICRAPSTLAITVFLASVISFAQATSKPETKGNSVLSKRVGDLVLTIKECVRTGNIAEKAVPDFPIRCVGNVENNGDVKIRVEFTSGRVIDDAGNEYKLWGSGPWGGVVANFSFGTGCCAQELIPLLPVKFGFWIDRVNREATALNPVLTLVSSGSPSQSEIVFRDIPIRRR